MKNKDDGGWTGEREGLIERGAYLIPSSEKWRGGGLILEGES